MGNTFEKVGIRVSIVNIILNALLSAGKLIAGIAANSAALITDGVQSASDVFSTLVVVIGIKLSAKEPDKDHPYGHERMECVAAIILATVLFFTAAGLGISAGKSILFPGQGCIMIPGTLAIVVAIVSAASKEGMYWYTRYYAQKIDSSALMAVAWDHRSDAFASLGVLVGVLGAKFGFPITDAIAGFVISLLILKAALGIFKDAVDKMVDKSCSEEFEEEICACVMEHKQVQGVRTLQTRTFGSKIYVDLELYVDAEETLRNAHSVSEEVHDAIEERFPKIKHIMIHVEPYGETAK